MGLFAGIFSGFIHKNLTYPDKRSTYIFYKIVGSTKDEKYALQCINTNAVFYAKITDIVFDLTLLHGLHPIQACYIGIEYASYLKRTDIPLTSPTISNFKPHKCSVRRYGRYSLQHQNRKGDLGFLSNKNGESFVMDSRDIALNEELIKEFDAAQAFYIGLLAGIKMNNPTNKSPMQPRRPCLKIIK